MSFSSTWLNSVDQQRAGPAGRPIAPAPDPEPGKPALADLADLAELAWLAARGTGWVLRRSTKLVFYPLAMAVREMHDRAHRDYQPLAPVSTGVSTGSSPRREDGTGVVVDLAAYRLHSQMARAPQLAQNAQPAGRSRQT
jgi:hypothetical protein